MQRATLNLKGGTFFGPIGQTDESTINIYGYGFEIEGFSPTSTLGGVFRISGRYSDGEAFAISVVQRSLTSRLLLHVAPEPNSGSLIFALLGIRQVNSAMRQALSTTG